VWCLWLTLELLLILALLRLCIQERLVIMPDSLTITVGKKKRVVAVKQKTLAGITVVVPVEGSVAWSASPAGAVAFESIEAEPQAIYVRGLSAEPVTVLAEADGLSATVDLVVAAPEEQPTFALTLEVDAEELD